MSEASARLGLRTGELVEVRSAEEILATLDAEGSLEALPFMPEMLQYCGKRFRVQSRAHKTCDTVNKTGGRRVRNAVHLEGLRCDGASHGGCQAACTIFFKEAWLKRVPSDQSAPAAPARPSEALARVTEKAASRVEQDERIYRCQATDLPRFSTLLKPWDPRQYLEDLWSGNVGFFELLRVLLIALFNNLQALRGGVQYPSLESRVVGRTPTGSLGLRVGDPVRIRSKEEIEATLKEGRNRGLWYDVEMVSYCGMQTRVHARIERIVDERSGKLVELPNPCLVLEDVYCKGHLSKRRLLCPRRITPYFREIWLERVEPQPADAASDST